MTQTCIRINDIDYPTIEITGKMQDSEWDNRQTKTIRFEHMTYNDVVNLLPDNVQWYIVSKWDEEIWNEQSVEPIQIIPHEDIFDNSDFCLTGPITDYRDGSISIKMGKLTDLEEAYLLLYQDEEE